MIELLNRHFVPVYISNEDYRGEGAAPKEEREALKRIVGNAAKARLSTGTVHAYVLTTEGHPVDSLHVAEACKPDRLEMMLEQSAARLAGKNGPPVVKPEPQSRPPASPEDALILHLTARSLDGRGCWAYFPVENWIVLQKAEWSALLPPRKSETGASWFVTPAVAERILTHFYPATENNNTSKNSFEEISLRANAIAPGRVLLDGRLRMKHDFYHKEDGSAVEAVIAGLAIIEGGRVTSLRMATEKATYRDGKFGVAVRSVP